MYVRLHQNFIGQDQLTWPVDAALPDTTVF